MMTRIIQLLLILELISLPLVVEAEESASGDRVLPEDIEDETDVLELFRLYCRFVSYDSYDPVRLELYAQSADVVQRRLKTLGDKTVRTLLDELGSTGSYLQAAQIITFFRQTGLGVGDVLPHVRRIVPQRKDEPNLRVLSAGISYLKEYGEPQDLDLMRELAQHKNGIIAFAANNAVTAMEKRFASSSQPPRTPEPGSNPLTGGQTAVSRPEPGTTLPIATAPETAPSLQSKLWVIIAVIGGTAVLIATAVVRKRKA